MIGLEDALLLTVIYGSAAVIHGITGFGFALFSVPLVAVLYGPATAVVMNTIVGTVNCAYKAWMLRMQAEYRQVLRFAAVSLLFLPVGVALITVVDREIALGVMGAFVATVGVLNLISQRRVHAAMRTRTSFIGLGALTGILGGAFGAPGPAVVPYFLSRTPDPVRAQANMQVLFTLGAVPVALSHAVAGNMELADLGRAAIFAPLVFVLTHAATRVSLKLPDTLLRRVVYVALIAMGLWLLVNNLVL